MKTNLFPRNVRVMCGAATSPPDQQYLCSGRSKESCHALKIRESFPSVYCIHQILYLTDSTHLFLQLLFYSRDTQNGNCVLNVHFLYHKVIVKKLLESNHSASAWYRAYQLREDWRT